MRELWAVEGVLWSAEGTYVGHKAIEQAAASLLRKYPEYSFAIVGDADEIPDAARIRWTFGVRGCSPAISGMDVVTAVNGRIVALYRFLDGAGL